MHDLVLGPFINRSECRQAIEHERHTSEPLAFSRYLPHEDLTVLGTRMTHISVLDLSLITEGGDAATALSNTRDLAQHAEAWGYRRYWVAEHHNMPGIASAATAVVIGHVASGTSTIRVGAGDIMLPNHAPLVIAEQFGTLASLYPGRIDLGIGRAPGTDRMTAYALRRNLTGDVDDFPRDVLELQNYFQQHLANLRRKDLLPQLRNDSSICCLGRLFCLELCGFCLNTLRSSSWTASHQGLSF
jgi:hypothetical protein